MRSTLVLLGMLVLPGAAVAASAPTTAIVVKTKGDSVSVIDLGQGMEMSRHQVGREPYGAAVSPDGNTVVVGVEGEGKVKFFSYPEFEEKGEAT